MIAFNHDQSVKMFQTIFTKQFMVRIEKEIFPEYKDDDLNLLEVTWQEDYVQQLGVFVFVFGALCSAAK